MGVCLTGNADPQWGWRRTSLAMQILTGNEDVPHQEWGCDSLEMQIPNGGGDVPH